MAKQDPGTNVTMRVRIGDSEVEVTGPADFVEKKIADFVARASYQTTQATAPRNIAQASAGDAGVKTKAESPAQFFKKLAAKSDVARVLMAAYYLEKVKSQENFISQEVRDLITQAKIPAPANVNDSINKNIKKGTIMTAGDRGGRMAFVLTSDGEEAVAQLVERD